MAQKKNLWQRLFSSADDEEMGLSVAERNAIQESLKSEYGLTIQQDNVTASELTTRNYRKLTGEEFSRINQIFQFIPQIAANSANQQAVNAAFRAATEGTYRVSLGAGMHLCRSHLTPGAYRAVGLSDATNQIAGNAELFANNASLTVSNAPQIALGFFNAASLATGQYFMSQINTKLSTLSSSISRVENLLNAQRHGELKTATQELSDIMERAEFIISDMHKTNDAINQLHLIQHIASNTMNTCQKLINDEIQGMSPDDKIGQIKSRIEILNHEFIEYHYAAQLYGIATLFEIQLRNVTDPGELLKYREQIERRITQFKQDYDTGYAATLDYMDKTHALNDRSLMQWIASGATVGAAALASGKAGIIANIGGKAFSFVDGLFSDRQKRKKEELSDQVNNCFEPLKDTLSLESPSSAINFYIETVGKEIEFIKIGEEYYTNLPLS
ncbi:MAG: hypothetical protein IJE71_05155 [Clostridia bacterium]|nr:hypothetical protein [Clostridia bacterium]